MSDEDNEFIQGDSGALNIELVEAGRRKPGSLLMMKETFPCKVVGFSTAKPGKHGSAKAMIVGKDIFTDKQYEETFGTSDNCQVPIVKKQEYTCIDINEQDDNIMTLIDDQGEAREDIKLPEEGHLKDLKKEIIANFKEEKKETLVTLQDFDGRVQVCGFRTGDEM